ncbi:type I-E CRISPR-associated protein Cas6/Cse3/CasE [Rhizobium sp. RU36D]|uniref:type I-E CRISPR-associated protein Cas6/Cse3/CasE n=1 Tax=Rhizobium sp. RU36D TaxID=1907415 RepID=UPI0009D84201|nr:type I-E CRISPR-associated protein Cas6/Cse3/CasE [Rhizobium sp. RU36D]SMD12721.1 CRISPR system Cascade subunit CasE [Rhizobium sp. RU36D]
MSALHLTSLPIDLREFRRLAAFRGFGADEGRALHHFLSETFGKSLLKPFRLMPVPRGHEATLYAYTEAPEEVLRNNLQLAAPEYLNALGTSHLALREMPGNWREGRRLAFDLRVRPVRRLLKPLEGWSREESRRGLKGENLRGPIRKGSEVDAFLIARLRQFPHGLPEDAETGELSRENVYFGWLAERFEGAAVLDRHGTRMTRFARHRVQRRDRCETEAFSEGPDAIFHGELTVADGQAFQKLLASGIGRHTAYGFGMLLLRPGGS